MNFLTTYSRTKSERGVPLVIQQYEYAGEQICFACMAKEDSLAEELYLWFRQEVFAEFLKKTQSA